MSEANLTAVPHPSSQTKTSALDDAEERILRDIESLKTQQAALEQIIDNIRAAKALRGMGPAIARVKPDEYKGMRAVDALAVYLLSRKGTKIPLARIVEDLVVGGVDPGQPRGRKSDPAALIAHTLKISLPNRRHEFKWSPDGLLKGVPDSQILVWLAEEEGAKKSRK